MNRDQIIQAGVDAGFPYYYAFEYEQRFERFAAAIRAAIKEEDARICDGLDYGSAMDAAVAIRASK